MTLLNSLPYQFNLLQPTCLLRDRLARSDFENPAEEQDLIWCSLCKDVLTDPTACKRCKGGPMCHLCFTNYLTLNNHTCPLSNCVFSGHAPQQPRKAVKALKALYFTCLNQQHGCMAVIHYPKLSQHAKDCHYTTVQCKLCLSTLPAPDVYQHMQLCNQHVQDIQCRYECGATIKSTMVDLHEQTCLKAPVECVGEGCGYRGSREEIGGHEGGCEHVAQTCVKCQEEVARKEQGAHDCVRSLVKRYKEKSGELTELTKQVESITLDINKQQVILDKLNQLNNEKARKVTEIERCLFLKRSRSVPTIPQQQPYKRPNKQQLQAPTSIFKIVNLAPEQQSPQVLEECRCNKRKLQPPILVGICGNKCGYKVCKSCKYFCQKCGVYLCSHCQSTCEDCFQCTCGNCKCGCKR